MWKRSIWWLVGVFVVKLFIGAKATKAPKLKKKSKNKNKNKKRKKKREKTEKKTRKKRT